MRFVNAVRTRPATVVIVALIVALWIVALVSHGHGVFAPRFGGVDPNALQHRRYLALATSLVEVSGTAQLVITIVAAAIGIGWSERRLGPWRTVLAFVTTGLAATALGLLLELLGLSVHEFWSSSVRGVVTVDPLTPIAGTVAWATAAARPLWRRRIRTVLVAGAAALLLYSGQPADLYLLVAVALGWMLGSRTHPDPAAGPWGGSMHETRGLLALTSVLLAVGPVFTLLSASRYGVLSPLGIALSNTAPARHHPIASACVIGRVDPACVSELTRMPLGGIGISLVSLAPFVLMLVGARGLLAGRRAAVWVLVALSVGEAAAAAWYLGFVPAIGAKWSNPIEAGRYWELGLSLVVSILVPLGFAAVLTRFRHSFPLRTGWRRTRAYLVSLAVIAVVPAATYLLVGALVPTAFHPAPTAWTLIRSLPERFLPVSFLRTERLEFRPATLATHLLTIGVGPVFWIAVVAATFVMLRGRRPLAVESVDARRVRALLHAGSDSLGFLATWAGTRLWTSADGRVGIPYHLVDGHAITVADPIGAADEHGGALDEFLAHCDRSAWVPVFYSIHDRWRDALTSRGWLSLPIAEETSLDPRSFSTGGKAMNDVRTSVNRAHRTGVHTRWATWSELPLRITAQISAVSEEWMSEKDLPELGFTLGGLDELRDPDVLTAVALDETDQVLAITSWLPVWRGGVLVGRTLDFMRRTPGSPNGTMEFLIADAMARFGAEGLTFASLSGSPLATLSEHGDPLRPLERVLALVGRAIEPVYGFRSLLRFKQKFGPSLEPLHLSYADPLQLPAIGLAIARAYLPSLSASQLRRLLTER